MLQLYSCIIEVEFKHEQGKLFPLFDAQEGIHTVDIAASINPSRRLYVLSLQPLYTGESFHFILLLILAVLHENILCSAEKDSMRNTTLPS